MHFLRAVAEGREEEVRAAIAADPEIVGRTGPHPYWGGQPQPLHVSIESGRPAVFAMLLESGAPVDGVNHEYEHWSPLMIATRPGREAYRDELLRRGARIGLCEALLLADDAALDRLLASGEPLPDPVPSSGSLLMFARTVHAVDRMVALGAPLALPDRWGTTPVEALSRVSPNGSELVECLLRHGVAAGAEILARLGRLDLLTAADATELQSPEVLAAAVESSQFAVAEWLLASGADANARTARGSRQTVLHIAAWNGDVEMAQLLIRHGADRAALDEEHCTTPKVWAETAVEIRNDPSIAAVLPFL